jgi:hypothetical protein
MRWLLICLGWNDERPSLERNESNEEMKHQRAKFSLKSSFNLNTYMLLARKYLGRSTVPTPFDRFTVLLRLISQGERTDDKLIETSTLLPI